MLQHANGELSPVTTSSLDWLKFVHQAFRKSHIHVILFCNCNLIGSTLSEPPEVNSLNPPILPDSFLTHAGRGNEPGDEATQTQLEVFGDFFHDSCACLKVCWVTVQTIWTTSCYTNNIITPTAGSSTDYPLFRWLHNTSSPEGCGFPSSTMYVLLDKKEDQRSLQHKDTQAQPWT